jgi:mRNA interferase HicA
MPADRQVQPKAVLLAGQALRSALFAICRCPCEVCGMTGHEFERRVRALGRRKGTTVTFDPAHGRGSHGRLYYGDRFTTLKDRRKEIGPGLLKAMLDHLGLRREDLEG